MSSFTIVTITEDKHSHAKEKFRKICEEHNSKSANEFSLAMQFLSNKVFCNIS